MRRKSINEPTPEQRREALAEDLAAFLKAGHKIDYIPDGVSGQDPQGHGKPLRLGQARK